MTPVEEWRTVARWPAYEVSNLGRVRRALPGPNTWVGRVLTPAYAGPGEGIKRYLSVRLVSAGESPRRYRSVRVSVLVAEAFLGPRAKGIEVNHKDGDHANNAVTNLEYMTKAENEAHAARMGLKCHGARWFQVRGLPVPERLGVQ